MRLAIVAPLVGIVALAGCEAPGPTTTTDGSTLDVNTSITNMVAGIWVDPNGCDHWIIDDGVEGYMTPRVTQNGRPVCRPDAVPETSNVIRTFAGNE